MVDVVDKPRGRKNTEFDDKTIKIVLGQILNNLEVGDMEVSAYHLQSVFVKKLGYVKFDLEKLKKGRGRRRKVYSLTPAGVITLDRLTQIYPEDEKEV